LGGLIGGLVADALGKSATFALAAVVCLLPGVLLPRWDAAARTSRGEPMLG
jgi:hypothetical protein